jgi:ammonium transporter, Amt family
LLSVPNKGRIAAVAAINTSMSAASGALSALFTNMYLEERRTGDYSFDLTMAMNGLLSGLVAVTAGCATVEPWAAATIGVVAGWLYLAGSSLLVRFCIDDAVDAIPVHLFSGSWGLIAAGLFSTPSHTLAAYGNNKHVGWFYSLGQGSLDSQLLSNQFVGLVFLLSWATITMFPFFGVLNYLGWLRADGMEELLGLDMSFMGGIHHEGGATAKDDAVNDEDLKAFVERKKAFKVVDLSSELAMKREREYFKEMFNDEKRNGRGQKNDDDSYGLATSQQA